MASPPRLSRATPGLPAAAPVRLVHLGLGNFHRAHQAWYTANAPDASDWGIAAFTLRRPDTAEQLAPQDGLDTLITRSADGDAFQPARARRSLRDPGAGPAHAAAGEADPSTAASGVLDTLSEGLSSDGALVEAIVSQMEAVTSS